jgi:hypothetical protein
MLCSCPVPLGQDVAVDTQRGAGIGVAEPACYGSNVYAGTYQLGGAEVAQVVEPALNSQLAG